MRVFPLPPLLLEVGGGVSPFLGKWVSSDFPCRTIAIEWWGGGEQQVLCRDIVMVLMSTVNNYRLNFFFFLLFVYFWFWFLRHGFSV